MTAVATIGLVIEASRHTASTPIRGPSVGPNDSRRIVPARSATPRITNGTVPVGDLRGGELERGVERSTREAAECVRRAWVEP